MNMKKHSYFCLTMEFALAIMNAKLKFYSHFKNKLSHSLAAGSDTIACGKVKKEKRYAYSFSADKSTTQNSPNSGGR